MDAVATFCVHKPKINRLSSSATLSCHLDRRPFAYIYRAAVVQLNAGAFKCVLYSVIAGGDLAHMRVLIAFGLANERNTFSTHNA